jgi:hypothetical protein
VQNHFDTIFIALYVTNGIKRHSPLSPAKAKLELNPPPPTLSACALRSLVGPGQTRGRTIDISYCKMSVEGQEASQRAGPPPFSIALRLESSLHFSSHRDYIYHRENLNM